MTALNRDLPGTLTAEQARWWLRAAEWNSTDAAFLLAGVDPWTGFIGFDESDDPTQRSRVGSVFREIAHVEGRLVSLEWDNWTPMKWVEAARKACLPIPEALAGALAELEQPTKAGDWPYEHDTRLLRAVRWVIETYSSQSDWPTRELVIEKLRDWHGLGKNEAEAVDTVTRPDSIRGR